MKKFMNVLLMAFLIILPFAMKGQSPPIFDHNWEKNTSLSDEFQGSSLNLTMWDMLDNSTPCDPVDGHDCWTQGSFIPSVSNVFLTNNDFLVLRATNSTTTGGVKTKNENYLYGYYEMRAKLPGYFNPLTNSHCSLGFWTAFWVYHQVKDASKCLLEHNEIDIVEPNGNTESDAQTNEVGCHQYVGNCLAQKFGTKIITNLPPLYVDFHKFAAECLPDRVIYYFDDVPFNVVYGQPSYPTHLMRVVIDNQLTTGINSNTPWPMDYVIDYFRFYQLKTNYCGIDSYINDNAQLASFQFGVRRNITFGNGSNTVSLVAGDNMTFRATNEITINSDFIVPLGSEINLIRTPCPL
jgi:beta-glucanase (GH16 family)